MRERSNRERERGRERKREKIKRREKEERERAICTELMDGWYRPVDPDQYDISNY